MKNRFRRYSEFMLGLYVIILALSLILIGSSGYLRPSVAEAKFIAFDKASLQVKKAIEVQNRHTRGLMAVPEVVGTATGVDEAGNASILVLTKKMVKSGEIPESLEGMPVNVKVTGEIFAIKGPSGKGKPSINPASKFPRPVPIGVSTGNEGECSSGTIGARVTDGTNVYALSNNHVYAIENSSSLGSQILQPGLYDTSCIFDANNIIGTLSAFVPIDFSGGSNTVDAAIALSSTALLGNSTPSNGYGTPSSTTVAASLGQAVQKYGRTTSLTKGTITGINATVNVTYTSGTATFVNQIIVSSKKPLIKAGDSGSVLVTYPGANPVGLLFAGNSSGTYSIANHIDDVLGSFGVTIDGK